MMMQLQVLNIDQSINSVRSYNIQPTIFNLLIIISQFDQLKMIHPDNLTQICTLTLSNQNTDFLHNIYAFLLNPDNASCLIQNLDHPDVSFCFCLAIKEEFKTNISFLRPIQEMDGLQIVDSYMKAIQKNNILIPLIDIIKEKPKKTRKYFNSKKQWPKQFYLNISHLTLLLFSQINQQPKLFTLDSFKKSLFNLKYETIALLLISILNHLQQRQLDLELIYQNLMRAIGTTLNQNLDNYLKILGEMVLKIDEPNCLPLFKFNRLFAGFFFGDLMSIFNNLSTGYKQQHYQERIQKIFRITEDYFQLLQPCLNGSFQSLNTIEGGQMINQEITFLYVPSSILVFCEQILKFIVLASENNFFKQSWLHLLLKIVKSNQSLDTQHGHINHKFENTLLTLITKLLVQSLQRQQFHEQLLDIVDSWFSLHYRLVAFTEQNFGSFGSIIMCNMKQLINVTQLEIKQGFNIGKIFTTIKTIRRALKSRNSNKNLNTMVLQRFIEYQSHQIMVLLCKSMLNSSYDYNFINYQQQKQTLEDFFEPIIDLITLLSSNPKPQTYEQPSLISIFAELYNQHCKETSKNRLFIRFLILFLKNIIEQPKNKSWSYKKCELLIEMSSTLNREQNTMEYLMMMQAIVEQIFTSNQMGEVCYFQNYLQREKHYNMEVFKQQTINNILSTIQNNNKETLIVEYSMDIMIHIARFCQRMFKQASDSEVQLLNRVIQPINNFIQHINETSLENLSYCSQRKRIYNIVGVLAIKSSEDLYRYYDIIQESLTNSSSIGSLMHYFSDINGLLGSKLPFNLFSILAQLCLQDLIGIDQHFSEVLIHQILSSSYYSQMYLKFIFEFLKNMSTIEFPQHNIFYWKIHQTIGNKISLFKNIYASEDYFKYLNEIYYMYSQIKQLYGFFPSIPSIFMYNPEYSTVKLVQFITWCFDNLQMFENEQIESLFLTVFRNTIVNTDEQQKNEKVNLRYSIIDINNMPILLVKIMEELIQRQTLEEKYKIAIENLLRDLFANYIKNSEYLDQTNIIDLSLDETEQTIIDRFFFLYKQQILCLCRCQFYFGKYFQKIFNQDLAFGEYQDQTINYFKAKIGQFM